MNEKKICQMVVFFTVGFPERSRGPYPKTLELIVFSVRKKNM